MGIGFHHEIRFDLPVSYYMSSSKSSPSFSYDLDFGFTSLNRILNKTFTITNLSFNSTYKFEICSNCAVMFVPSVGHLKPMVTKTIVASFCTNEPLALEKVNINCHVVRIEYVEPSAADISWDDRQEMMVWKLPSQTESGDLNDKDGSKTKLVSHTEPEIIEKSEHDFIKLFITGKADYAMYITTMKEIVFPNTFLNEQSTVEFEVINDGTVPLQITWAIKDFEEDDVQRPFTPKTESLRSHDCSLRSTCSSTSLSSLFSSTTPTGHPASTFPEMHVQKKNPFRVIPESDTIPVHSGRRFQVTFAPIEASLYTLQLISNIPSLSPTLSEIEVALMGKAILPEYYFELEYTDYLNSRPHIPNCNNEDIANCKIIEFLSIGVGVVCTRKFNFVNPDKDDTTFRLSPKGENNHFTYFSCKSNTGIVKGSKKCEICFTFTPQELGAYEEFYQFHVEGKNPTTFLLAGQCREPHVYFKTPFITIEPTLLHVAKTVTVELKNDEYQECPFRICKGSLLDGNSKRVLEVIPMSGNVAPRSETSVKIIFNAEEPGPVNFDLRCTVRQIKEPLHLGISANCLTVVSKVFYTDVAGDLIILKADEDNYMNFKNVMLKNPSTQKISIVNEGYIGFYYTWHVDKSTTNPFVDITIEEEKGFLAGGTFNDSVLTLTPQRKSAIHDMKIILQISYGPKYVIKINAIAGKPLFKFSFVNYDFGHCLVQKNKSKYYGTLLTCKNYDTRPLVIENLFDTNANLSVNFKSATIAPNSLVTIPIYFHPLTVGKHHFAIPFDVSTSKYIVNVNGNAVKLNIQLFDIRDKFIDIGSMKVGSIKKRAIQVLNKTPTEMDVYFALWDHLPMRKRPQEKAEMILKLPEVPEPVVKKGNGKIKKYKGSEDKKKGKSKEEGNTEKSSKSTKKDKKKLKEDEDRHSRSGSDQLFGPKVNLTEPPKMDMSQYVKISPKTSIHMLPDKKYEIIVEFNAKQRLEEFVEKIFYEVQDYALPLCVVKGSYVAPEFSLDKNMLTFANVVLGCHRDMYILLQNTGDLKGRFKWVVDRNDQFEIHPMDGVIMPKTVMKICITYRPKVMQCQLILKSKCIINGVTHLPLTIVANSVNWPNPAEHLTFFCPVRTETSQTVTLYNNTKVTWNLKPILTGEEFIIPDEIMIPAETNYLLHISYVPRAMNSPHKATIFLELPEGQALLYDLTGTAQPPLIVDNITREIPCKKLHKETLKVENWLNRQQTFTVKTELISTPTIKSIYRVTGKEVIALPPNATKKYNWNIYVVNEEPLKFRVTFTNPDTKEYLCYEISLKLLPSGPLDAIYIETCLRELKKVTIKLENPINIPVTFFNECRLPDILYKKVVTIPPHSTHNLELCYFPIKVDNSRWNFEVKSDELGMFIYSLNVKANPPLVEKVVRFETELGEKSFASVSLRNNFMVPVELNGKFENPAFLLESSTATLPGEEGRYVFCFEPFELGITKCKAVLSSPMTGDFIYPLTGECTPPKPKGPYTIRSGGMIAVNFTNPFLETKEFHFTCDNKDFLLRNNEEEIRGRKSTNIIVTFVSSRLEHTSLACPSTAKMTVKCLDPELHHITWLYYLQGDNE
ncbi:unnamed protein product [Acanthoscelides obtectus]|nr:unnamed protein product [Acanthoscelides obtectus]CAK1634543.1 Hydrocephalus-inducing protein homolog [Acanthoscelides obtectus]